MRGPCSPDGARRASVAEVTGQRPGARPGVPADPARATVSHPSCARCSARPDNLTCPFSVSTTSFVAARQRPLLSHARSDGVAWSVSGEALSLSTESRSGGLSTRSGRRSREPARPPRAIPDIDQFGRPLVRSPGPLLTGQGAEGAKHSKLNPEGACDPPHQVSSTNPKRGVCVEDDGRADVTGRRRRAACVHRGPWSAVIGGTCTLGRRRRQMQVGWTPQRTIA